MTLAELSLVFLGLACFIALVYERIELFLLNIFQKVNRYKYIYSIASDWRYFIGVRICVYVSVALSFITWMLISLIVFRKVDCHGLSLLSQFPVIKILFIAGSFILLAASMYYGSMFADTFYIWIYRALFVKSNSYNNINSLKSSIYHLSIPLLMAVSTKLVYFAVKHSGLLQYVKEIVVLCYLASAISLGFILGFSCTFVRLKQNYEKYKLSKYMWWSEIEDTVSTYSDELEKLIYARRTFSARYYIIKELLYNYFSKDQRLEKMRRKNELVGTWLFLGSRYDSIIKLAEDLDEEETTFIINKQYIFSLCVKRETNKALEYVDNRIKRLEEKLRDMVDDAERKYVAYYIAYYEFVKSYIYVKKNKLNVAYELLMKWEEAYPKYSKCIKYINNKAYTEIELMLDEFDIYVSSRPNLTKEEFEVFKYQTLDKYMPSVNEKINKMRQLYPQIDDFNPKSNPYVRHTLIVSDILTAIWQRKLHDRANEFAYRLRVLVYQCNHIGARLHLGLMYSACEKNKMRAIREISSMYLNHYIDDRLEYVVMRTLENLISMKDKYMLKDNYIILHKAKLLPKSLLEDNCSTMDEMDSRNVDLGLIKFSENARSGKIHTNT